MHPLVLFLLGSVCFALGWLICACVRMEKRG